MDKALMFLFMAALLIMSSLYWYRKQKNAAIQLAQTLLDQAQAKASLILEEAKFKQKELLLELEQKKLSQEHILEKEAHSLTLKEDKLSEMRQKLLQKQQELDRKEKQLRLQEEDLVKRLDMSLDETKELLLKTAQQEIEKECQLLLLHKRQKAEKAAEEEARQLLVSALSCLPKRALTDASLDTIQLPNEEIKAKIIGRDGKNIKAFQHFSGVNVVIDETPQTIILSSFDLERREIAKLALYELIRDGRINPARIEEELEQAQKELQIQLVRYGQEAALSCQISHLHPELLRHLGALKLRTSFGQNLLEHSVEVAQIMSRIACELKLDVQKAARMGLLHDIGKAISSEIPTSHAVTGYRLCLEYGETEEIANGVGCHHDEIAAKTQEALLVKCADYLSGARRGSRAENSETFFKRLKDFETQALGFYGVKNAFAISAGRELQVFVRPEIVDDAQAMSLAKEIAGKIQPLAGPFRVQVSVIRQTKCIEYT